MIKKYFKCELLTDIVINGSLATEGNMTTLNYIPGSNFLGIVAGQLYKEMGMSEETYQLFHSEDVLFGNAEIFVDDALSYVMPFSIYRDKLKDEITDPAWVHHHLNLDNLPKDIQLKQQRKGFFNKKNQYIKQVNTEFSLKSAYNREERRSDDGKMFGFESIKKGQSFAFYVIFKDEKYVKQVVDALQGVKRIGKSKSAQFGQVEISLIDEPSIYESRPTTDDTLVIYAESNLCFINEYGQSTFRPTAKDFGLEGGVIDWTKSQIRTYSYSPWNSQRNTTSTQRDCIAKGSVIVIDKPKGTPKNIVGEYVAEGLGRVIFNPEFLEAKDDGTWKLKLTEYKAPEPDKIKPETTPLGTFLKKKKESADIDLEIGKAIQDFIKNNKSEFENISTSQWGGIRAIATHAKDTDVLYKELFETEKKDKNSETEKKDKKPKNNGFLMHGVAADEYWSPKRIEILKKEVGKEVGEEVKVIKLGTKYIAKLAAEMAKQKQKQKSNQNN